LAVLRSYLLSRSEITALVGSRVARVMPDESASPRWPALRLTEITTTEIVPVRLTRMSVQVDAWAASQAVADNLARLVAAVLRDGEGYVATGAVLCGVENLATSAAPDESVLPIQPRAILTGYVFFRPNP
ncbi:MAG: DUF3168 domain-containing protein, partial [Aquihabitans sp.]